MSDHCTIYSATINYTGVVQCLENLSALPVEVIGAGEDWEQISVSSPNGKITFKSMVQKERGDKFSHLMLATHNYFSKINTDAISNKTRVINVILDAKFIIGVTAEPGFIKEERHFDFIFAITKELNGLVFNGSGMIDEEGHMLLDTDGSSEVLLTE